MASTTSPSPPTASSPQACLPCRNKHKRCDGAHPCGKCVRIGKESECSYSTPKRRGPKPSESVYDVCNTLKEELELQRQISEHWKEQYLQLANKSDTQSSNSSSSPSHLSLSEFPSPGGSSGAPVLPPLGPISPQSPFPTSSIGQTPAAELPSELAIMFARSCLMDSLLYQPEFDVAAPSPRLMVELWSLSVLNLHHMRAANPGYLVDLFTQAVFGMLGSGCCGYPQYSQIFLQKAEFLCNMLCANEQEMLLAHPELAHALGAAILLMWTYLENEDATGGKSQLILLVYDIVSRHNQKISPGLMLRTHLCRLSIARSVEDAEFWYQQVIFLGGIHAGGDPTLIQRSIADVMYGFALTECAAHMRGPTQEQILLAEHRLGGIEFLIEQGVVVAVKFPQIARILEDSMLTVRLAALATRARLLSIINRAEDVQRLIQAACMMMQTMRPSLHLFIQAIRCLLDAAITIHAPSLVAMLLQALAVCPPLFPGVTDVKQRAAAYLQQAAPGIQISTTPIPRPVLTPEQQFAVIMQIRDLSAPCSDISPDQWTPEQIQHELAIVAMWVQRFAESHSRMQANLQHEIDSLASPPLSRHSPVEHVRVV